MSRRRRRTRRDPHLDGMLERAGVDPERPLTDEALASNFVDGDRYQAYQDYCVAKGQGNAARWHEDDCRVSDDEALDRIAEVLADAGQQPGVEYTIAAIVRATGRRHVRAAGEQELERAVDRQMASQQPWPEDDDGAPAR